MRDRLAAKRAAYEAMAAVELAAPSFPPRLLLTEYAERAPRCPACRGVIARHRVDPALLNMMCACGWRAAEIGQVQS
jgi:hypothetical protein